MGQEASTYIQTTKITEAYLNIICPLFQQITPITIMWVIHFIIKLNSLSGYFLLRNSDYTILRSHLNFKVSIML